MTTPKAPAARPVWIDAELNMDHEPFFPDAGWYTTERDESKIQVKCVPVDIWAKQQNADSPLERGDIIQVTDRRHHWFGCLVVVSEPLDWGCLGYVTIPNNDTDEANGNAYIRLKAEQFEAVGKALLVAT